MVVITRLVQDNEPLTLRQAARLLNVSTDTVRRYVRTGEVVATRLPGERGHIRIGRAEVDRLLARRVAV